MSTSPQALRPSRCPRPVGPRTAWASSAPGWPRSIAANPQLLIPASRRATPRSTPATGKRVADRPTPSAMDRDDGGDPRGVSGKSDCRPPISRCSLMRTRPPLDDRLTLSDRLSIHAWPDCPMIDIVVRPLMSLPSCGAPRSPARRADRTSASGLSDAPRAPLAGAAPPEPRGAPPRPPAGRFPKRNDPIAATHDRGTTNGRPSWRTGPRTRGRTGPRTGHPLDRPNEAISGSHGDRQPTLAALVLVPRFTETNGFPGRNPLSEKANRFGCGAHPLRTRGRTGGAPSGTPEESAVGAAAFACICRDGIAPERSWARNGLRARMVRAVSS